MRLTLPARSPASKKVIFFVCAALLALCVLGAAAGARRGVEPRRPAPNESAARRPRGRGISLQPEASKLGRRLGQRFRESGGEVSVLSGLLTFGAERRRVVLRRMRGEAGETLEVTLGGGPMHTWDDRGGARQAGRSVEGEERLVVERLALDSPDQFVLAQLRGASYYTVARGVRPEGSGGADDYTGPLWDVVRVSEPEGEGGPTSRWRLYYVNAATGFIDRVVSQEGGETLTAELSGWAERGGEVAPSRVVWTRGGQPLMELTFENVSHGPKQ